MGTRDSISGTTGPYGCHLAEPLRDKGYQTHRVDEGLVNFHTLEFPYW